MAAVGWGDRVTLDVEQVWAVLMTSGALIKGTFRIFSEKNKKVIKLSGARVDPCVSVCWPMFNQAGPGSGVRGVFPFSLWKLAASPSFQRKRVSMPRFVPEVFVGFLS